MKVVGLSMIAGLCALAGGSAAERVGLKQTSFDQGKPVVLGFVDQDTGKSLKKCDFKVEEIKHSNRGDVVASKAQVDKEKCSFKVDGTPAPGLYRMVIDGKSTGKQVVPFKITTEVELSDIEALGEKLGKADANKRFSKKHELSTARMDKFTASFSAKDAKSKEPVIPHQAMLRLTNVESGRVSQFAMKSDTPGNLKVQVNIMKHVEDFDYESGSYKAELVVGDAAMKKPVLYSLGEVNILMSQKPEVVPPKLYEKALLHESDTTLSALKEIKHIMRPQDSRPAPVVSYGFTGLVIFPTVLFTLHVLSQGYLSDVCSNMPSGLDLISFLGFNVSILLSMALFVFYWLESTMFVTLGYLSIIVAAMVAFGLQELRRLARK